MADNITTVASGGQVPVGGNYRFRDRAGVLSQTVAPDGGAPTNGSGTITTGGTSQQVFAANEDRVWLLIQNVSDTVMWINFGTAAVANQPSILLAANGGFFESAAAFCPTGTVNIICATTGKAFTAKEF